MSGKKACHELALEVTVLSAQSLKDPSFPLFSGLRSLRPYVALSVDSAAAANDQACNSTLYRTRVDEDGGLNPTWGDTIRLPLRPSFFLRDTGTGCGDDDLSGGGVRVSVLSRRLLGGHAELGWCRISACDVIDGLRPPAMWRRLSYNLRSARHGGPGHGVIHVAARLVGPSGNGIPAFSPPPAAAEPLRRSFVAIGIPVAAPPALTTIGVEASTTDTWQQLRPFQI